MGESPYIEALADFVLAVQTVVGSDVICVVVLLRNGAIDTHTRNVPGWTLRGRLVLFYNLLKTALIEPWKVGR